MLNVLHIFLSPDPIEGMLLEKVAGGLKDSIDEQVFICEAGSDTEAWCFENDLTSFSIQNSLIYLPANAALVKRISINYSIDVIHVHDALGHTLGFVSSARGSKIPQVVSRTEPGFIREKWLTLKKFNYAAIALFICASDEIREQTAQIVKDRAKLHVLPPPETDSPDGWNNYLSAILEIYRSAAAKIR